MKNFPLIFAVVGCVLAGTTFAEDFKSVTIGGTPFGPVRVHGDQSANVLAAAIIDTDPSISVEVINDVVIDGPANVTVTCGTGATCFVTYRKDSH